MLSGHDPLAVLHVTCDGTQDDLLDDLLWRWGQVDTLGVLWTLLMVLLEDDNLICESPGSSDLLG